ncbi:hypothetical protein [Brevibacillus laterosporus]|uniref:Uncharacterized protein n=1 Tax=Brevibacillus laterosporus TaxID=1465 RepID=A0AAP8QFU9_BRELA|nr:hypothetical protein [Brevibacillus laterosporus]PPB10906.1 hypothetical protein C4A77_04590 [Brevibacillus laterosporus]
MNASKLAKKIKRIIDRHIKQKGYEVEAVLQTLTEEKMSSGLSIIDNAPPELIKEAIKIVVTGHSIDEEATALGDNPVQKLEFISIETGSETPEKRVEEGKVLIYDGKQFNIILASPATLAGELIIKECQARSMP